MKATNPDELTVDAAILTAPDGNPVIGTLLCYCGPHSDGESVLKPLRSFGPPLVDLVRPMTISEAHWAERFIAAMKPFAREGVFVNWLGDEGHARVRASYEPNYKQLVRVKDRCDPTNFFHLNQNIPPTSAGTEGRKYAFD